MGNAYDELEIVHCTVDLISGNHTLFDRSVLFEKFNDEAVKLFKHYGVKYEIGEIAGLGGGGILSFFELIKQLWEHKELISIIFASIKSLYKFLIALTDRNRPRVHVNLWIKTSTDLQYVRDSDLEWIVISELINLKRLSDELCNLLKKAYPIFVFDQFFSVSLHDKSFIARFSLADEYRNSFNNYRLNHLFKKLKIKANWDIRYSFERWGFIKRLQGKTKFENRFWIGDRDSEKDFLLI